MIGLILISIIFIFLISVSVYQKVNNAIYKSRKRLDGKTAIVTGGTAGIGFFIARVFAERGARVIIACPFDDEGKDAKRKIKETTGVDVVFKHLDLASLASVREFAKDILSTENRLDILVNNAGVGIPADYLTKDGLNFIMQVNYYGHFLLTMLLLPLLKKSGAQSDPSRIINMSSLTHRIASTDVDNYNRTNYWFKLRIYSNSKLGLVLFSRELSRRLSDANVVVNCSDPGFAATRIYKSANEFLGLLAIMLILLLAKTTFQGAQTAIYLGVDDDGKTSGEYFANCRQVGADSKGYNQIAIDKLWEQSIRLVKLTDDELKEAKL
ncbi:unnamed protein product [Leptosia nina]|uniref:Uncharacterized protein n=1 Tax=Leptosia nina TaxID=320188 RepID=A0AAV1JWD0_9NEOP